MDPIAWIGAISGLLGIVSAVGGAFYMKGVIETKVAAMETRQDKMEAKQEKHADELVSGRERFARIDSKLDNINDTLKDMRDLIEKAVSRPN